MDTAPEADIKVICGDASGALAEAAAVVFDPATRTFAAVALPIPALRTGEILVRIRLTAICGSDLHTASGRRSPGGALVLGHEICGEIAALGDGVKCDYRGAALRPGDRVTWSLFASCGNCFYCRTGLPQKCERVFKYGHAVLADKPSLSGGYASRVVLRAGTAVFRLPDAVPDSIAVFANCALATGVGAVRTAGIGPGESLLIQGGGLLGLSTLAAARAAGAGAITVVEGSPERRALARAFGADRLIAPGEFNDDYEGAYDVVIEMCGQPSVIADGIRALRIGGRYVLCGCVSPGAEGAADLFKITTRCLRVEGLHNYIPADLDKALRILEENEAGLPFSKVVAEIFPLEQIEEAFEVARTRKDVLRVAVQPPVLAQNEGAG